MEKIVATYIGDDCTPFKNGISYDLLIVENSVREADSHTRWTRYPTIKSFFQDWIVTGAR